MTNRRGFLQSVGAALGSTLLPGSTVASVLTAAPLASAAAPAVTAAATWFRPRQFRVQGGIIDAATFEPKTSIVLFNPDGSCIKETVMYSEILDDPARRAEAEELDKLYPDSNVHRRWSVLATRIILEKQGMPPLTPEEEIAILEGRQPLVETADA
jgi:hypothetical protein